MFRQRPFDELITRPRSPTDCEIDKVAKAHKGCKAIKNALSNIAQAAACWFMARPRPSILTKNSGGFSQPFQKSTLKHIPTTFSTFLCTSEDRNILSFRNFCGIINTLKSDPPVE
jgi:hypothetical protein